MKYPIKRIFAVLLVFVLAASSLAGMRVQAQETSTAYVLHYDSNHKQVNNTIRGFAPLEKSDNSLSFSSQDAFFTAPGTSGTFYVVYTSYSIDAVGTIIIFRTVSDGIAYTFPDQ